MKIEHICKKEKEINDIHVNLQEINTKLDIIYKKLMGNGSPGIIEKWYELEGSVKTWKMIVIISGLIISLLTFFLK